MPPRSDAESDEEEDYERHGASRKRSRAVKQDVQKHIFGFVFLGKFDIDIWKVRQDLGLHDVQMSEGNHGFRCALIKVAKKKRASYLEKLFDSYDKDATPVMKINLTKLPTEDRVIGFGHGLEFMNHVIFQEIQKAKQSKCPSYITWNSCNGQDREKHLSKESGLRKLLETDMDPSLLNTSCPKNQRSDRGKKSHVEESDNIETPSDNSADDETMEPPPKKKCIAMEEVPELRSQEQIISNNGTGIDIQAPHALTDLADLYLSDEESLLQTTTQESSPKTQRLERIEKQLEKLDKLEALGSKLLDEHESRDLLVTKVIEQAAEIEDHKLKRDQQEAKTAIQTRAANLAIESKMKAEQEALKAKQIATEERRLREIAEKEKSALMSSNIQLTSSLATLSARDSMTNWKLKDGYEYLEDFVNLLQIRGVVDPIVTRRSLKGITDPVQFSNKALRRYYNHIMAYVDPKEASKSEDKHRLYLGMLSGPVYPLAPRHIMGGRKSYCGSDGYSDEQSVQHTQTHTSMDAMLQ